MNEIKIISLNGCPYSMAAENLIKNINEGANESNININIINVSYEDKIKYVKKEIKTFPQIYFNNILIGGYDDFNSLYLSIKEESKLDEMVKIINKKTIIKKRKDMLRLIKFIVN
jgi:glutaredoxin